MSVFSNPCITIPNENLFVPHAIGPVKVRYDGRDFSVISSKGDQSTIQRANLAKELRGISTETLHKMLKVGYFSVRQYGNEYALRFDGRLKGGGPLGAVGTFFVTWGAGALMCAAGTVMVATGVGAPAGAALIGAGATTMGVAAPIAAAAVAAPTP